MSYSRTHNQILQNAVSEFKVDDRQISRKSSQPITLSKYIYEPISKDADFENTYMPSPDNKRQIYGFQQSKVQQWNFDQQEFKLENISKSYIRPEQTPYIQSILQRSPKSDVNIQSNIEFLKFKETRQEKLKEETKYHQEITHLKNMNANLLEEIKLYEFKQIVPIQDKQLNQVEQKLKKELESAQSQLEQANELLSLANHQKQQQYTDILTLQSQIEAYKKQINQLHIDNQDKLIHLRNQYDEELSTYRINNQATQNDLITSLDNKVKEQQNTIEYLKQQHQRQLEDLNAETHMKLNQNLQEFNNNESKTIQLRELKNTIENLNDQILVQNNTIQSLSSENHHKSKQIDDQRLTIDQFLKAFQKEEQKNIELEAIMLQTQNSTNGLLTKIQSQTSTISSYKNKIAKLKTNQKDCTTRIKELEHMNHQIQKDMLNYDDAINAIKNKNLILVDELQSDLQQKSQHMSAQQVKIQELENTILNHINTMNEMQSVHKIQIQSQQNNACQQKDNIIYLNNENIKLKDLVMDKEEQLSISNTAILSAEQEISGLKKHITELAQEIDFLEDQRHNSLIEISNLNSQISKLEQKLESGFIDSQSQINHLKKTNDQLELQFLEITNHFAAQNTLNQQLQQINSQSSKRTAELEMKLKEVLIQLQYQISVIRERDDQGILLNQEINHLNNCLAQIKSDQEQIKLNDDQQFISLQRTIESLQKQIQTINIQSAFQLKNQDDEFKILLELQQKQLEQQRQSLLAEINQLNNKNKQLNTQIYEIQLQTKQQESHKNTIQNLEFELIQKSEQLQDVSLQKAEFLQQIIQIESEISIQQGIEKQQQDVIQEQETTISNLQNEIQRIRGQNLINEQKLEDFSTENSNLLKQILDQISQSKILKRQNDTLELQLSTHILEANNLESKKLSEVDQELYQLEKINASLAQEIMNLNLQLKNIQTQYNDEIDEYQSSLEQQEQLVISLNKNLNKMQVNQLNLQQTITTLNEQIVKLHQQMKNEEQDRQRLVQDIELLQLDQSRSVISQQSNTTIIKALENEVGMLQQKIIEEQNTHQETYQKNLLQTNQLEQLSINGNQLNQQIKDQGQTIKDLQNRLLQQQDDIHQYQQQAIISNQRIDKLTSSTMDSAQEYQQQQEADKQQLQDLIQEANTLKCENLELLKTLNLKSAQCQVLLDQLSGAEKQSLQDRVTHKSSLNDFALQIQLLTSYKNDLSSENKEQRAEISKLESQQIQTNFNYQQEVNEYQQQVTELNLLIDNIQMQLKVQIEKCTSGQCKILINSDQYTQTNDSESVIIQKIEFEDLIESKSNLQQTLIDKQLQIKEMDNKQRISEQLQKVLTEQIEKLKVSNLDFAKSGSNSQTQHEELLKTIDLLKEKLQSFEIQNFTLSEMKSQMNLQLKKKNEKHKSLEQEMIQQKQDNSKLQEQLQKQMTDNNIQKQTDKDKITQLQNEIQELFLKITNQEALSTSPQKQSNNPQLQLNEQLNTIKQLNTKIQTQQDEYNKQIKFHEQLQQQLKDKISTNELSIKKLEQSLGEVNRIIPERQNTIDKQANEIQQLKLELIAVQQNSKQTIVKNETDQEQFKSILQENQKIKQQLADQILQSEICFKSMDKEFQTKILNQQNQQSKQIYQFELQQQEQKEKILKNEVYITQLEQSQDELKKLIDEKQNNIDRQVNEMESLHQELTYCEQNLQQTTLNTETIQNQLTRIIQDHSDMKQQLVDSINQYSANIKIKDFELQQLKAQISEQSIQIEQNQKLSDSLKAENNFKDSQIQDLTSQSQDQLLTIEQFKKIISRKDDNVNNLQQILQNQENKIHELHSVIQSDQNQIQTYLDSLAMMQTQLEQSNQKHIDLQSQLDQNTSNNLQFLNQSDDQQIHGLKQKIQELESFIQSQVEQQCKIDNDCDSCIEISKQKRMVEFQLQRVQLTNKALIEENMQLNDQLRVMDSLSNDSSFTG